MEEPPAKETPAPGLNKIDLSQLQDFRFGTQWTEVKSVPGARREREPRREGPDRGDGRPREPGGAEARRDRRSFRRPAGAPADLPAGAPGSRPAFGRDDAERPGGGRRREFGPRGDGPPRREGERRWSGPRPPQDQRPYLSTVFNVAFYPEDTGFAALVKAMRSSCRTFELFEIARLILGKFERFVVVLTRRPPEATPAPAAPEAPPAAAPAGPGASTPPLAARPAPGGGSIFVAVPDGIPFETEEAAIAHVLHHHLGRFFDLAAVTVDPPKGTFPFVNRCTLSGELLGPPNYHRYQQIVQQHHATRFARMPFERFRETIETVRDPAVVAQWLEKMKQVTRYTWKPLAESDPAAVFDDADEARAHLLATAKARMVKAVESARFHAKLFDALPAGEIRRAVEGQLERQRRFPLDTANALRGRLRREGFTIFKKGAKGVSYVCAVKRKFRIPGQSFAAGINALITFLEANPMITVKELPQKLLGITPPAAGTTPPIPLSMSVPPMPMPPSGASTPPLPSVEPPAAPPAEPAPGPAESSAPPADAVAAPAEPPAPEPAAPAVPAPAAPAEAPPAPALTPEEHERLRRMTMDLRWLVTEGYVTEFADGRLFAPPPMVEARPRSSEVSDGEEHDLESFPEVPGVAEAADEAPPAAPTEIASAPAEPPAAPEIPPPAVETGAAPAVPPAEPPPA